MIGVTDWLEQSRPAGLLHDKVAEAQLIGTLHHPNEHFSHEQGIHWTATIVAFSTAAAGFLLASVFYGWRIFEPGRGEAAVPDLRVPEEQMVFRRAVRFYLRAAGAVL